MRVDFLHHPLSVEKVTSLKHILAKMQQGRRLCSRVNLFSDRRSTSPVLAGVPLVIYSYYRSNKIKATFKYVNKWFGKQLNYTSCTLGW